MSLGPNGEKIGPTFSGELLLYGTKPGDTLGAITNWSFSWASDGTFTWGSVSQNDINKVMAVYNVHDAAKSFLLDYSESARYNKEISGITVNGVYTQTDLQSQQALHAVYTYCQIHSSISVQWKLPDLTFITYTATQITNLFDKVNLFVQNCFNTESSINSGIKAGSVTTNAQIDAAYANIPTNY
jgi:hypothetical protein